MTESPSLLLQRAAELIESRAGDVLAKDWVWDEDIYRVMSRPHAGDVAICSTDLPEGQWIAMANPLWAAPLVAWLREAVAASEQYGNVPKALMQDSGVAPAYRFTHQFIEAALEFARLILGEPRKD